jgi:hypothetical protein
MCTREETVGTSTSTDATSSRVEQRVVDLVLVASPHEERADDRGDDAQRGDRERQHHEVAHVADRVEERTERHRAMIEPT